MGERVKVALAGIAGYGDMYLTAMFGPVSAGASPGTQSRFDLVGVVDPAPQRCRQLEELWARRVKIYPDLPSLYADVRPDLLMVVTPIHLHAAHTLYALERGSHVLCEKPLAATVKDARRIIAAETMAKRFVAIGYQWSFSKPVQALKRDILAGHFGRPKRLKSIVFFPRGLDYFNRNDWAGRIKTVTGEPVYDSPANNAAAHYLHNMFYLLGPTRETSAMPVSVQAELYRANEIENYDTAAMRVMTDCGGELLFYTSHAVPPRLGPIARYEFEDAVISYEAESGAGFVARFRSGRIKRYGEPNLERHSKMWQAIEAVRANGHGEPMACGPRAAMAHTLCVAAAQASMPQIRQFPASMLVKEPVGGEGTRGLMICVNGLHAAMVQCYDQGILPHEHGGLDWAAAGQIVHVKDNQEILEEKHEQVDQPVQPRSPVHSPPDLSATPQ
ncbi:Gfo/Idh/MocA family protein [Fontivita pretiosa]|uniref:Gfo/Idh/MocA family protein n=1 Tax=Fontivita pretiosa TaxID=2989684 RepID=UPI003D170D02